MLEGLHFKALTLAPHVQTSEKGYALAHDVAEIKGSLSRAVSSFRENCIRAGFLLKKLRDNGYYRIASRFSTGHFFTYGDAFLSDPFLKFCKDQFGLCKTTVYSLIQVSERFGDSTGKALPSFEDFEYSQLIEMSSMSDIDIKQISSDMTVSKIRSLKKKKKEESVVVAEEPKEVKIVVENPYLFSDVKNARDEFKIGVKRFFEKGNYKIMINGSFIGGQAFGAELFDYLLKRGVFNANKES